MRKNKSVLFLAIITLLVGTQFSCKKEESAIALKKEEKTVTKKYFYIEEISTSGDTTRTPVVTVN